MTVVWLLWVKDDDGWAAIGLSFTRPEVKDGPYFYAQRVLVPDPAGLFDPPTPCETCGDTGRIPVATWSGMDTVSCPAREGNANPAFVHDRHMRHVEVLREQRDEARAERDALRDYLRIIACLDPADPDYDPCRAPQIAADALKEADRGSGTD